MIRTLAILACLACGPARAEGALMALAQAARPGASPTLTLADLAAARAERLGLLPGLSDIERTALVWNRVPTGDIMDFSLVFAAAEPIDVTMGFGLDDIDGIATWGRLPDAAGVLLVPGALDGMPDVLPARGFALQQTPGGPVWSRGEDNAIDLTRRAEDMFVGAVGVSQRYAVRGDLMVVARSDAVMAAAISDVPVAARDADIFAMVGAVEGAGDLGTPIQVEIFRGLVSREAVLGAAGGLGQILSAADLEAFRANLPEALPPFAAYGFALWQDGLSAHSAILISYPDAASAETAATRFPRLLEMESLVAQRPFSDILPAAPVIRTEAVGGRTVVIIAFAETLSPQDGPILMGAAAYRTLQLMRLNADIDLLIGAE